jgi:hypothetical protein
VLKNSSPPSTPPPPPSPEPQLAVPTLTHVNNSLAPSWPTRPQNATRCGRNLSVPSFFPATSPPVCSGPTNPGNSNETNRAFFVWVDIASTTPDNFTIYDEAIKTPLPLIVATWLKDSVSQGEEGNGWADTKLMCIPENVTEPGSRTLAEATKGGAIRLGPLSGQLGWVVGLSLVLGLVL